MPLLDFNDSALWDGGPDSLYRVYRNDVAVGYDRSVMQDIMGSDVDRLVAALESKGLRRDHRIALIGSGFGWMGERMRTLGFPHVCSVETSKWIHAHKAAHAVTDILDADVLTDHGRKQVLTALGNAVDWAISEDILPILHDNEIGKFGAALRALASRGVAHWVTCGTRVFDDPARWAGDPRLNWKTLEQWKALVVPDYVVSRSGAEVL